MKRIGLVIGWLYWETTRWSPPKLDIIFRPIEDRLDRMPGFEDGVEAAYNQRVARQYRRIYRKQAKGQ